ncbi:MAG: hypothetical protein C5B55_07195 [Blastocatellia bacterium]|nr:MAG: hypothetical protein C5B55_07195 [Blastocatellia bacterium]
MVMIVFNGLSALFGLISAIALFSTYLGGTTAKWSVYLAATFCTIISVYQTLSFFFALNLRRRMREGQSFDVIEFRESPDRAELPPPDNSQFVPVGSVTENTTELLERKH